jgi:DNA-binding transcriptional ArsR family regulator
MVNNSSASRRLDDTFIALAHPIRRGIIARLARGEASVAELARPHGVSAPAITKHLHILERAGLLARRKEGRVHRCRTRPKRLDEAAAWIERYRRFWNERLDALERYLKKNP